MQNDIQLVMLGGESGDRVSNFIRNNLPNGDPLFAALCERMKPEQYEGSQFECTMDFLYSVCVNPTSSAGIEPYSFAMMQNGRYLAISLGTRETYPKDYDFRDMALEVAMQVATFTCWTRPKKRLARKQRES